MSAFFIYGNYLRGYIPYSPTYASTPGLCTKMSCPISARCVILLISRCLVVMAKQVWWTQLDWMFPICLILESLKANTP